MILIHKLQKIVIQQTLLLSFVYAFFHFQFHFLLITYLQLSRCSNFNYFFIMISSYVFTLSILYIFLTFHFILFFYLSIVRAVPFKTYFFHSSEMMWHRVSCYPCFILSSLLSYRIIFIDSLLAITIIKCPLPTKCCFVMKSLHIIVMFQIANINKKTCYRKQQVSQRNYSQEYRLKK